VNVAVMVGGFPRKEGMERKDVMSKNVSALEAHAAPNCKVWLVDSVKHIGVIGESYY
jgi:malate/lactate dehydrogenase